MVELTPSGLLLSSVILISSAISAIACFTIALLVFLQLRQDKKSRSFLVFVAVVGCFNLTNCLLHLVGRFDPARLIWALNGASVLLSMSGASAYYFAMEYLDCWSRSRSTVMLLMIFFVVIVAVAAIADQLFLPTSQYLSSGLIQADDAPATRILLKVGFILFAYSFFVTGAEFIQQLRWQRTSIQLFAGLLVVFLGSFSYLTNIGSNYSAGSLLYTVGVVLMLGPVVHRKLLDPVTRLNDSLARRANQLGIIMRLSQHVISLLSLDELLATSVKDICEAFGYYAVTIYSVGSNGGHLYARAAAGFNSQALLASGVHWPQDRYNVVGSAALSKRMLYIPDVSADQRFMAHSTQPHAASVVCIPLLIGHGVDKTEILVGVLEIRGDRAYSFTEEDLEVLQVLAQQLAFAVRNADLYEQAQRQKLAADHANEAKSRFLSILSHELRTPLTVIINLTGFMAFDPDLYGGIQLPDAYRDDMLKVEQASRHLHGLINNVLDLSRIEAEEMELELMAFDPVSVLEFVKTTSTSLLTPGVDFRTLYSGALPYVWGDEVRFRQILLNLVGNAAKFTKQGRITLNAYVRDDRMILFSVADTGCGIPLEAQGSLFNRFKQASKTIAREHGGSGLGLAISKQLVQLHGGDIWFESSLGVGSTFYFTFPLAPASTQPAHIADSLSTRPLNAVGLHRVAYFRPGEVPIPDQIVVVDSRLELWDRAIPAFSAAGYALLGIKCGDHVLKELRLLAPVVVVIVHRLSDQSACYAISEALRSEIMFQDAVLIEVPADRAVDAPEIVLRGILEGSPAFA